MKKKTRFHSAAGTILCITVCKRGTSAAYGQQQHIDESPAGGEIIMPPLRGLERREGFLYRKLRFATHTVMHNFTPAVLSSPCPLWMGISTSNLRTTATKIIPLTQLRMKCFAPLSTLRANSSFIIIIT